MNDYHFKFPHGEIIITVDTYEEACKTLKYIVEGDHPPQDFTLKSVDIKGTTIDSYFCTECNRPHRGGTKIFEKHFQSQNTHL